MKCKTLRNDLIFYAEDSISAERRQLIDSHLEECSECREFLIFLKQSVKVIEKDKEISSNPFLYTRILTKIDANEHQTSGYSKRLIPAFAFSIILAASILGGVYLGKLYSENTSRYSSDLQEEISYLDEIKQESIETFFLTSNDTENE